MGTQSYLSSCCHPAPAYHFLFLMQGKTKALNEKDCFYKYLYIFENFPLLENITQLLTGFKLIQSGNVIILEAQIISV